jgi:heptosyltransferase-1
MFEDVERILIVKLSSIGDVINAFPVAVALRERFPDAEIAWVVEPPAANLVAAHQAVDRVFVLSAARSRCRPLSYLRALARLARPLRECRFQVALDLQGLLKSGLVTWLSRAPVRLGLSDDRREAAALFVNVRVPPRTKLPVGRYLSIAAFMGADVSTPRAEVPADPAAESWAERLVAERVPPGSTLVALCPGASDPYKRWPVARFVELGRMLTQRGVVPVVVGGPGDAALAQAIRQGIGPTAIATAGETTLLELASLLRRCVTIVAGDTGPLHLAVAVGIPVVGLFGPTDPGRTGPYGEGHIVISKRFPCGPCLRRPTCREADCMHAITAEEVADAVGRLLRRAPTPAAVC